MRLGIIGSRTFADYDKFLAVFGSLIYRDDITVIVSGGAIGADLLAEKYADYWQIPKRVFFPDWQKHGKKAGFVRNAEIVAGCDVLMAFWDGQSRGTKDSIDKARQMRKTTIIVYV